MSDKSRLTRCAACDHEISVRAKECPNCGHQVYVTVYGMFFFAAFYLMEMHELAVWPWPLKITHAAYMLSMALSIVSGLTYSAAPGMNAGRWCTRLNYAVLAAGLFFQHVVYVWLTKY